MPPDLCIGRRLARLVPVEVGTVVAPGQYPRHEGDQCDQEQYLVQVGHRFSFGLMMSGTLPWAAYAQLAPLTMRAGPPGRGGRYEKSPFFRDLSHHANAASGPDFARRDFPRARSR